MRVKILGISAGRKNGNTDYLVKESLKGAEDLEIGKGSFLNLSNKKINGCIACHKCFGHEKGWGVRDRICYAHDDDLEPIIKAILEVEGIIMGAPVYVFGIPSKLRALMERTGAFTANGMNEAAGRLRHKSFGGIAVAAGRRAGQDQAAGELLNWALCMGMTVVPAFPTENGLPASSVHVASADCVEAKWYLSKRATRKEHSVMPFPLGAISAIKSAQNIGRNVAFHAAIIKSGLDGLRIEGLPPPATARFRSFSGKIKKGSYLQDLVRQGLVKIPGKY